MNNYIYTGRELISENELKHWKYIKKKKVNGKWRYYYSDPEYTSAKQNKDKADKELANATYRKFGHEDNLKKEYAKRGGMVGIASKEDEAAIKKARDNVARANNNYKNAMAKQYKAREKYKKITLKTLPRRAVAKGAAAVANMLSKLFK